MSGHDDVRHSLGSYALGNLDPADQEDVAAHLRTCVTCRAELALLQPLVGVLDLAGGTAGDPVSASPLLEHRVLEDRRRAVAEGRRSRSRSRSHGAWRGDRWWSVSRPRPASASLALVGVLAAVGIAVATGALGGDSPAATVVTLRPATPSGAGPSAGSEATARIVETSSGSRVALDASLPPTERPAVYEVWFVSARGRISAGTFQVRTTGRTTAQLGVAADTSAFQRIGITREPDADDPARNGQTVLSAPLPG